MDLEKHRSQQEKYRYTIQGNKKIKEYNLNYNLKNKEKRKEINARPEVKEAKRLHALKPEVIKRAKEIRKQKKLRVYNHYSNYDIKCNCCGERHIEFLAIDHINNDGYKHRKSQGVGKELINWIIKNNFPNGFQILCFNCNWAKGQDYEHLCVHQKEKVIA